MVKYAKLCYTQYPTIVNALKESGITYHNSKADYAAMDNKFSKSRIGIGYSSNLAQLAMTYYWTELSKETPDEIKAKQLYDNFVILSVIAQIIIDGCKREYEIDGNKEIDRISKMDCMTIKKSFVSPKTGKIKYKKYDFPEFMKYTREIKYTKDGKELPQNEIEETKNKLKGRINSSLICPMNWLEYWLDKIQNISSTNTIPTSEFFIKMNGKPNHKQMTKIMSIVNDYDGYVKNLNMRSNIDSNEYNRMITEKSISVVEEVSRIKIKNIVTINRLIETALSLKVKTSRASSTDKNCKYTRKLLNLLYKTNREKFLDNFVSQ